MKRKKISYDGHIVLFTFVSLSNEVMREIVEDTRAFLFKTKS
jgi:hypothetical protein